MEDYFKTKPDLKKAFQIAREAASETKEPIEKEAEPKFPAPVGPDSADSTPTESRSSLLAAPEIAELLGLIKALARCWPKDNAETMQAFSGSL